MPFLEIQYCTVFLFSTRSDWKWNKLPSPRQKSLARTQRTAVRYASAEQTLSRAARKPGALRALPKPSLAGSGDALLALTRTRLTEISHLRAATPQSEDDEC